MPTPKARPVEHNDRIQQQLQIICRRQKSSQRQVRRASIILSAANGNTNLNIAKELKLSRTTVALWRERFAAATADLTTASEQLDDKELLSITETLLSDNYRSGSPATFSAEQILQIIALACETPSNSKLPSSHWTAQELATEAMKRGIVKSISAQSIARFLKRGRPQTSCEPLLVESRPSPTS